MSSGKLNTSAIWQEAQEAVQMKACLNENYWRMLKTANASSLSRRTRADDRKAESNDSPEIPDRRMTLDIPVCVYVCARTHACVCVT